MNKLKECLRCGNAWYARVPRPKQCPNCKRMDWDQIKRVNVVLPDSEPAEGDDG